ncbi:MAG: MBL fold metallo-hydrolase [Methanocorpusculum sp.]|nr:MBL fold metallo-hydrolase [Methanocorpusculum sp.]MBR5449812.1 MBL fold metallo-hydrolase [Methanocorpusculum sp.]
MSNPITIEGRFWQANSYLVGNTLIDAGIDPERILPYKDQIEKIVLTHGHFDHTVHANEIANLTGAKIYIGEHELPFLTDSSLSLSTHFGSPQIPIQAEPLKDGDVIDGFTVFHTPGHTGGSICLFREEDGILIAGDTIFPEGSYGRYDFPTGSISDLRNSVSRMAELPVESLWSGHGEPVEAGAKAHVMLSKRNLI